MKVVAVRPAGVADVYNMEVDDTHDFAVGGGVIVHNCYDSARYVLMRNPMAPPRKVEPKAKPYDPLDIDADNDRLSPYEFYKRY